MSRNTEYSYSDERRTADLMATLDFLENLLPADADPVHRQRLTEIRRRVLDGGDDLILIRERDEGLSIHRPYAPALDANGSGPPVLRR